MKNRGLTITQKGKEIKVDSIYYNDNLPYRQALKDMRMDQYEFEQLQNNFK